MFFSHLHNVILDDTLQMRVKETAVNIIKEARNRGIQLIAGTDVILPQKSNSYPALYDELKYFVELVGMTPFEEIHSATYLGAKATGIETTHGSIELDKIANLVVLNDNPIENINNIKSMNIVIKHGKIIK